LVDNISALLQFITNAKPSAAKGVYLRKVAVSATMLPSILVTS
jgi:large subunit ribosomal protein L1